MGTGSWIFALIFGTAAAAAASAFEDPLPLLQEIRVGAPVHLWFGEAVVCNRLPIPGRSRFVYPNKFAHAVKILLEQDGPPYRTDVHACLHNNATREMCDCPPQAWTPVRKGFWSATCSPFEELYLDVKAKNSHISRSFVVTATEEFRVTLVMFLVTGFALILLSETLSFNVTFYYSSAMLMGVLFVVLILLFQGMKLLPSSRKKSLYFLVFGSAFGLGVLQYMTALLTSTFRISTENEDILLWIVTGFVVIVGAWLGYWGVRKFVLLEDGQVDVGTGQFVKWVMRVVGALLLLQSSYDTVLAVLVMALAGAVCRAQAVLHSRQLHPKTQQFKQRQGELLQRVWTRTSVVRTVKVASPQSLKPGIGKDEHFFSTFHKTPDMKQRTVEDVEETSKACTYDALRHLISSSEFANWAVTQTDRISVAPSDAREERPDDEIEKTAIMDEVEPVSSFRKRFT